jgi:hypothetical protein
VNILVCFSQIVTKRHKEVTVKLVDVFCIQNDLKQRCFIASALNFFLEYVIIKSPESRKDWN